MRKDARDLKLSELKPDNTYEMSYRDAQGTQQPTKEYLFWHKMVNRCKPNYQKTRPSYVGYTVSPYFQDYNNFARWCKQQPAFYLKGSCLDKDLLNNVNNTRIYSEDTCLFLPTEINSFLTMRSSNCKVYTGVSYQKACGKYIVSCSQLNSKNKTLGRFTCPKLGYQAYRDSKVALAKIISEEYSEVLDERAIEIFSNFDKYIDLFTINPKNKALN